MRPCLRQLVRHKQRGTLTHPRMDGQLDSTAGDRVDELGNSSTSANPADLILGNVQQVVQAVTLEQHVVGKPHEVATIGDNLTRVCLVHAGGNVVQPVVLPQCVQCRENGIGAQVSTDGLVDVPALPYLGGLE